MASVPSEHILFVLNKAHHVFSEFQVDQFTFTRSPYQYSAMSQESLISIKEHYVNFLMDDAVLSVCGQGIFSALLE